MPSTASVDILRDALAALPHNAYGAKRDVLGPLHQKVCDVVDELRASGMAPEHVMLMVKGIAGEAAIGPLAPVLVETMVTWCIERYFNRPISS